MHHLAGQGPADGDCPRGERDAQQQQRPKVHLPPQQRIGQLTELAGRGVVRADPVEGDAGWKEGADNTERKEWMDGEREGETERR